MKILPELEEIKRIAEEGKYDILPMSCEILSDFTTPIEVMRILKNVSKHCYMLESAQADETWGRYTFLGFNPKMEFTCRLLQVAWWDTFLMIILDTASLRQEQELRIQKTSKMRI